MHKTQPAATIKLPIPTLLEAAASTGIMDVRPKFAKRAPHRSRRVVWSGNFDTFALQIGLICSTKITIILDREGVTPVESEVLILPPS